LSPNQFFVPIENNLFFQWIFFTQTYIKFIKFWILNLINCTTAVYVSSGKIWPEELEESFIELVDFESSWHHKRSSYCEEKSWKLSFKNPLEWNPTDDVDEAIRHHWRQNRHITGSSFVPTLRRDTLGDNGETLHATKSRKPKLLAASPS